MGNLKIGELGRFKGIAGNGKWSLLKNPIPRRTPENQTFEGINR
jgi:hypothetical protein